MKNFFAAATVVAALVFASCGSSEEKPAEKASETTVEATAPDSSGMESADSTVRDSASTRPVVTPNKTMQRSIPPKPAE